MGQPTQAGSFATGVKYHPNGAIKEFTYGNGLIHTMVQNARQLPVRSLDTGGALDHEYSYDRNGNVLATLDHNDSTRSRWMAYDNLNRLTDAGSVVFGGDHWHRFTYDVLDNLRSWKLAGVKDFGDYTYESNRLTSIKTTGGNTLHSLGYNVQGNLSSKDGTSYSFDFGNRLRNSNGPAGYEGYRYDGHARRVLAWTPAGSKLTMYSSAGQVMFQHSAPQQKMIENIYLGGSLVASQEKPFAGGVEVKYQHTDALGSPVAVSNQAGSVIDRTNYDPYGGAINKAVDGIGYTGHVMDPVTGLTYMQQRYYDPAVGRFLSVDPVTALDNGDMRHFNRYAYAYNNPYSFMDPDGRSGEFVALRGFIAFVAADAATPDPSDVAAPGKAAVYGSAIVGLAIGGGIMWAINNAQNQSGEGAGEPQPAPGPTASSGAKETPPLPTGLVGNNPQATGKYGGTGVGTKLPASDYEPTVEGLTGGNLSPHPKIPGAQQAPNGVVVRPGDQGPRIDVPANGSKPPEIIHFPKGADGK